MDDAPPVQYFTTSDGQRIAYGVSGTGDPLVLKTVAFSHVQLNWQHRLFIPSRRLALEALASRFRLVTADTRGLGMSSRGPQAADLANNVAVSDTEELVDHLRLEKFVLVGPAYGGHVAVHYALAHPERIRALVLVCCPISMQAFSPGFAEALPVENWELFLQSYLEPGLSLEEVRRGVKLLREITTQEEWVIAWRTVGHSDIGSVLPDVTVPTLVIHARDFIQFPAEESMRLAARIPNARMTIIDGEDIFGEPDQLLQAIERFLDDVAPMDEPVPSSDGANPAGLSAREIEVLRLVAAGRSNARIADELVISASTVAKHVSSILDKIGVANRTEAAGYARDRGLV